MPRARTGLARPNRSQFRSRGRRWAGRATLNEAPGGENHGSIFTAQSTCTYTPSARPLLRRRARRACPTGPWGPWGPPGHTRRARRSFSSDVPHRPEQPAPPYEPYYVPHGPHGVRRAVLAGREARADPGGAPARARRPRHLSERGGWLSIHPLFRNSENYRWFGFSLYMSIFSHRELF